MDEIEKQLKRLDKQLYENNQLHSVIFDSCPLVFPALGLITGILFQHFFNSPAVFWLTGLLLIIGLSSSCFFIPQPHRLRCIAYLAALSFLCLGGFRHLSYTTISPNDISHVIPEDAIPVVMRGHVLSKPFSNTNQNWALSHYGYFPEKTSFYLQASELKTIKGWQPVTGNVRVTINGAVNSIIPGDSVQLYCWLSRFSGPGNPGEFNFQKYMNDKQIYCSAWLKSPLSLEIIDKAKKHSIQNILLQFRSRIFFSSDQNRDLSDSRPLLDALIFGKRTDLSSDVYDAFANTGLAHFISLSGLHLGIIAGFIWQVTRRITPSKSIRGLVCLVLITLYILLVPPRAPILRAYIICALFCLSVIFSRKANSFNALSLAALILLLINPLNVFNIGWQLSFGSVLSILLFYKPIYVHLSRFNKWPLLTNPVLQILAVGLAAWIGGAGFIIYHFNNLNPFSAFFSVLLFPLVTVILIGGFIRTLLVALIPVATGFLDTTLEPLANLLILLVQWLSNISFARIFIGPIPIVIIILYYGLILIWRSPFFRYTNVKFFICISSLLLLIGSIGTIGLVNHHIKDVTVTCLAVGRGQTVVATLPGNHTILFDCGSMSRRNAGQSIILPFLKENTINKLDAVFISHNDIDHLNAAPEILNSITTNGIYVNNGILSNITSNDVLSVIYNIAKKNKISFRQDHSYESPEGVTIDVLWPPVNVCSNANISDNDKSQVILIEYQKRKILICGDIEYFAQQKLLELYPHLDVDVLVMPHHGTTVNLVPDFYKKLRADHLIISCNKTQYNTTAIQPIEGYAMHYTCHDGAITVKIAANGTLTVSGFQDH